MGTDKSIFINLIAGLIGKLIGILGPIIIVPLMFRTWGQEIYGEWLLITAIPAYIMLTPDMGLSSAIVNEMAFLVAKNDKQLALNLYRTATIILLLLGAVVMVFGVVFAGLLKWNQIGVIEMGGAEIRLILFWFLVQMFVAHQMYLLSGIYRAVRKNPRYLFIQTIQSVVMFGICFAMLFYNIRPTYYAASIATVHILFWMILLVDSRRIAPFFTFGFSGISFRLVKPYILPGLGHAGMPLIHALQNQGVLLVLGAFLGASAVSVFQTLRVMSNGIKSILGIISSAIIVELPSLLGGGNIVLVQRILIRNMQVALLFSFVALGVFFYYGRLIYQVWIGNSGNYSNALLLLLVSSVVPFSVGSSFSLMLLSSNLIHKTIIPLICFALISIGVVAWSSMCFGMTGVGFGIVFWEIGIAILLIFVALRKTQIDGYGFFVKFFDISALISDCWRLIKRLLIKGSY